METVELFSARVCPFAHRCRLALMEKGLPFEVIEIDLRNKPAWYRQINPDEAVPALRQGHFMLRESLIINEYIDELVAEPPLLPASPQGRARARLWAEFANTRFVPLFYRLLKAQGEDERVAARDKLVCVLSVLNAELHRSQSDGGYWFGQNVGLTDIAFYPWFERWPVLEHYRGVRIPGELTSLLRWIETMQGREVVKKARQTAEFYIAGYEDYARGG
ncbi:MAG: glutathione S-transferase family protein [Pedobacter sp.]